MLDAGNVGMEIADARVGDRVGDVQLEVAGSNCVLPPGIQMDLIDDMEDGDGLLLEHPGRVGSWWATFDPMATITMRVPIDAGVSPVFALPASDESRYAANFAAYGFAGYWANMGFVTANAWFNDGGFIPYDMSPYIGLSFLARGTGSITLYFLTVSTAGPEIGGSCTDQDCYANNFGIQIALTSTWTTYKIPFCQLGRLGTPATARPFDMKRTMGVVFSPGTPAGRPPPIWDFWIDDVAFLQAPDTGSDAAPRDAGKDGFLP